MEDEAVLNPDLGKGSGAGAQTERQKAVAAALAKLGPAPAKDPVPAAPVDRWAEPEFDPGPDPFDGLQIPPDPFEELAASGVRAYRADFEPWQLDEAVDQPPDGRVWPAEAVELANLPQGCWLPDDLFASAPHVDYYAERLRELTAAQPAVLLAMLAGSGTGTLGYEETVEHLAAVHRVRCWLDARDVALEARLADRALAQLPPPAPGAGTGRQREALAATSAAEELGLLLGLEEHQARARLDQAIDLQALFPGTLAAMGAGDLDRAHAAIIVNQGRSLPEGAIEGFEEAVLAKTKGRSLRSVRDMARRLRERTHPDTITKRRRKAEQRRNVGVDPAPDSMAWLNAYLPAEQAAAIDDRLTRAARHLRAQEGETRSTGQLRADVFTDLLIHGGMEAGPAAGIHAQPAVTVPVLSLLGVSEEPASLDGYGPIPAGAARALCADAKSFYRILTHPETGARLSYGRTRYRPPKDLQRMVRQRDEICPFAGCRKHGTACQIDHTTAFRAGGAKGETDAANLSPPCDTHHRLKTNAGWDLQQPSPGEFKVTTPAALTYESRPGEDAAPGQPAYPPAVTAALPEDQRQLLKPYTTQAPPKRGNGNEEGERSDSDGIPQWHRLDKQSTASNEQRPAVDEQQKPPAGNPKDQPPPF
jgi:hypothetical protein